MQPSRDEVLNWLEARFARKLPAAQQADVLRATGYDGHDAEALMRDFAESFGVDMRGYRAMMHHHGDGRRLRPSWPVPVTPVHGALVPLSVGLLHRAAVDRRWTLHYPNLPVAQDLSWINLPLLAAGLLAATVAVLWAIPRMF